MQPDVGSPGREEAAPKLWIVRGAPGVGKSAVGRRIRRSCPSSAVVEVDVLRSMVTDIDWTSSASHELGLRLAADAARSLLAEGYDPVVVIDTLLGDALAYFLSRISAPVMVFTLVAREDQLSSRARGRGSGFQNQKVMLEMNRWFLEHAGGNDERVDTTNLTADQVAAEIVERAGQPARRREESHRTATVSVGALESASGRLLLVRHARPDYAFQGPYDVPPGPPISAKGLEQARSLGEFLERWHIDRCISSPFERAMQTARIASGGRTAIEEAGEWGELGPSEPYRNVLARVRGWLEGNLPRQGETVLIVGHGASLNAALELLAPGISREAPRDRHGNLIPQGGLWLVELRAGEVAVRGSDSLSREVPGGPA